MTEGYETCFNAQCDQLYSARAGMAELVLAGYNACHDTLTVQLARQVITSRSMRGVIGRTSSEASDGMLQSR